MMVASTDVLPIQHLTVGSRDSELALVQTRFVMAQLQQQWPGLTIELKTFKTQGDIQLDVGLAAIGDKGLFVKELELALLSGDIDLAVHSLKDMPTQQPDGLALQPFGDREDPRDVLLVRPDFTQTIKALQDFPTGATIGTSSLRRVAQLMRLRNDLNYLVIRGNLQTRYRKLIEGQYDGIILAAAGVHRLGWQDRITHYFDPVQNIIPAVCQGVLGVEFRQSERAIATLLQPFVHADTLAMVQSERAFLRALEGGCQVPIGAYATRNTLSDNTYTLQGIVLSLDGTQAIQESLRFTPDRAEAIGQQLAQQCLDQGAARILQHVRDAVRKVPQ